MSSVDFIEINLSKIGMVINILIDVKNNLMFINNIRKVILNEKINEFFRIIRNWEENYESSNLIDSERFSIKIVSGDVVDTIACNGTYPNNYIEFKRWIEDIYE